MRMLNARWLILKSFVRKEILQVLRDKRMRFVLFVAPMVQLMIFGVALSNETKNVRLALSARSTEVVLSDLYTRALGTRWFVPAKVSGQDPVEWIQAGEADAVLVQPAGGVERNDGKFQLLINAQNSMRAQAIDSYIKTIQGKILIEKSPIAPNGLKFDIRALYNPTLETSRYMVPGVLSMLVCLVTILLTAMAVAREKEIGTIETLTAAPIDSWDLLLGKTVPFILIGSVQAPLILIFGVVAFGLPVRGPLLMLVISTLLMIASTVSIGLLISTIAGSQQQAMMGGFMYLFPSYLLAGLMFPIENMPFYFKPFAYINPLTHYMGLLRNILLLGGDWTYFVRHALILAGIGSIIAWFALRRFKQMLG